MVTVWVEERGGDFDAQGLAARQVDDGGGAMGAAGHELGGGLGEEGAGLALVVVRDGVLDEGGGGFDGQELRRAGSGELP